MDNIRWAGSAYFSANFAKGGINPDVVNLIQKEESLHPLYFLKQLPRRSINAVQYHKTKVCGYL